MSGSNENNEEQSVQQIDSSSFHLCSSGSERSKPGSERQEKSNQGSAEKEQNSSGSAEKGQNNSGSEGQKNNQQSESEEQKSQQGKQLRLLNQTLQQQQLKIIPNFDNNDQNTETFKRPSQQSVGSAKSKLVYMKTDGSYEDIQKNLTEAKDYKINMQQTLQNLVETLITDNKKRDEQNQALVTAINNQSQSLQAQNQALVTEIKNLTQSFEAQITRIIQAQNLQNKELIESLRPDKKQSQSEENKEIIKNLDPNEK